MATPPRGQSTFQRKAIIMTIVPPSRRAWTPEDILLLRRLVSTHTHSQIAEILGRSKDGIMSRCRDLRLKRPCVSWTPERFLSVLIKYKNGCWVWPGKPDNEGYGRLSYKNEQWRAHCFSYEIVFGQKAKYNLHHTCENKMCVNPDHLEDITQSQHVQKTPKHLAITNARKTHCKHGHEFTIENTYMRKRRNGFSRMCKECVKRIGKVCWRKRKQCR